MEDNNQLKLLDDNNIIKQIGTIRDTLTLFKMQINTLQQQLNYVEKNVKKQFKIIKKEQDKSNKQEKNKRAPSGFAKPTKVSKELCTFLNIPEGSEIARTEVTKALTSYIKNNNLIKDKEDKKTKYIIPNQKLKDLLGLDYKSDENLTYFNIQKYMNKHFYKNNNSKDALI